MTANGNPVAPVPLWLEGKPVPIDSSRLYPVISSKSGQKLHEYQSATVEDSLKAAAASGRAFKSFKNTTVAERRAILSKFSDIIARDTEKLVHLQQEETSAGLIWARNNVNSVLAMTREVAGTISTVRGAIPQIDKPQTVIELCVRPKMC